MSEGVRGGEVPFDKLRDLVDEIAYRRGTYFYILHLAFCCFAVWDKQCLVNRKTEKLKTTKCKSRLTILQQATVLNVDPGRTYFYILHLDFCCLRFGTSNLLINRKTESFKTGKCKS